MTSSQTVLERYALDEVERRLSAEGYTVVREPRADQLPPFVGHFLPDAIATGKTPNLLIEVITRRGSASAEATKIEQLRKLVAGDDAWRLEVVYSSPSVPDPNISAPAAIRDRLAQIRSLAAVDRPATLIMAWSMVEAVARALLPERAERPLTPASAVQLLASLGYIDQIQADTLRKAGRARNLIVHGDLTQHVSIEVLQSVLDVVDVLESGAASSGGPIPV